jgi:hypothetical protein
MLRALSSAAIFRAGSPASSAKTGRSFLGTLQGLVPLRDPASIEAAQLEPLGFLRRKGIPRALRDHPALFLGKSGIKVKHERVRVSAQLCHNERRLMGHQAADEMDVAAQSIEFGDDDRRLSLPGGLERGGKLRPAIERIGALAGFDLFERLGKVIALSNSEPLQGGQLRLKA